MHVFTCLKLHYSLAYFFRLHNQWKVAFILGIALLHDTNSVSSFLSSPGVAFSFSSKFQSLIRDTCMCVCVCVCVLVVGSTCLLCVLVVVGCHGDF